MSAESLNPDPILSAVRRELDASAASIDPQAFLARLRQRQPVEPRRPRRAWLALGMAGSIIAATFLLAFYLGGGPEPRLATAAEVLQQAQAQHAVTIDHQYELQVEWEPSPLRASKLEPLMRKSIIWTRGDQFRLESKNPLGEPVIWGQDNAGRIWIALSRKRGLLYEPHEFSEQFLNHVELMSLRVLTMLGELLEQYELCRRDAGRPGEPIRIEAHLRKLPNAPLSLPRFAHVELELDPLTKVIQRATLKRLFHGEVVSTMTFQLLKSDQQSDRAYELRTYLDADGQVFDGKPMPGAMPGRPDPRAKFRDEFLKRFQSKFKP